MRSKLDAVIPHGWDTPAAASGSHQNKSFKIETVIFIHIFQDYLFHVNQFEMTLQDSHLMKK